MKNEMIVIIHGIGTGIVKKEVHEALRVNKDVLEYAVEVDSSAEIFDLSATAEDSSSVVTISDQNLKKKTNIITQRGYQLGKGKRGKQKIQYKKLFPYLRFFLLRVP